MPKKFTKKKKSVTAPDQDKLLQRQRFLQARALLQRRRRKSGQ